MTIHEALDRVQAKPQVTESYDTQNDDERLLNFGIMQFQNIGAIDMFWELQQMLAEKPESADVTWENGFSVFGDHEGTLDLTPDKRVRMSLQWGFDAVTQTCNVVYMLADTHPDGSVYVFGRKRETAMAFRKVWNKGGKDKLEDAVARAYLAPARMSGHIPQEQV